MQHHVRYQSCWVDNGNDGKELDNDTMLQKERKKESRMILSA